MATRRSRNWLLWCLAVCLAISGCLVGLAVMDEEAKERALDAERAHITEQLENASCVESWGLENYGGIEESATVTDRSDDGVSVRVTHPYWYGTSTVESDGGSNASYLVTADTVRRVDGTVVSPC